MQLSAKEEAMHLLHKRTTLRDLAFALSFLSPDTNNLKMEKEETNDQGHNYNKHQEDYF